jgi:glycosyltransferase involved in cell wall biosynthesis
MQKLGLGRTHTQSFGQSGSEQQRTPPRFEEGGQVTKLNIAQVTLNFRPVISGVGQVVYDTSKELARRGHNVTVLTAVPHKTLRWLPEREVIEGFNLVRFPSYQTGLRFGLYDPYVIGLTRHLSTNSYDIIHCHSFHYFDAFVCVVLKRIGITQSKLIVHTHHPFEYAKVAPIFAGIYRTVKNAHVRFILNTCDRVLAITPHDVEGVTGLGVSVSKVSLLPNGIQWSAYQAERGSVFRRKYLIEDNERIILFLGRLDSNKGLPFLIDSITRLIHEGLSFKVVIAGEDFGMKEQVERLVERSGIKQTVLLTGRLGDSEKIDALKACDILVLPSSYEGFGLVLLEAQAAGKPVIASRAGGMPYALQDMQTGFLVSYGASNELSAKLRLLLEDEQLRRDMGMRGREFAKRFDYTPLTTKLIDIYDAVLTGVYTAANSAETTQLRVPTTFASLPPLR